MLDPKTYVIYYTWPNTAKNHSGMTYLFRKLKRYNNHQVRLIQIPTNINSWNRYIRKLFTLFMVIVLRLLTSSNDKILFVEYLGNSSGNQTEIAQKLRKCHVKSKLYGIVHLSESYLLELYGTNDYVIKGLANLDKVIVFGSSLQDYFIRLGYSEKVITIFHYVDCAFYKPAKIKGENKRLRVIATGSLKRNHNILRNVVEASPNIDFDICMGHSRIENIFNGLSNVRLFEFIPEEELLKLMQNADISISVFDDTVGSNVITTSLACGLPQVVSNVGSIKDYCDDTNSILCDSITDFVNALDALSIDRERRLKMSESARLKAEEIDIANFNVWFNNYVINT